MVSLHRVHNAICKVAHQHSDHAAHLVTAGAFDSVSLLNVHTF